MILQEFGLFPSSIIHNFSTQKVLTAFIRRKIGFCYISIGSTTTSLCLFHFNSLIVCSQSNECISQFSGAFHLSACPSVSQGYHRTCENDVIEPMGRNCALEAAIAQISLTTSDDYPIAILLLQRPLPSTQKIPPASRIARIRALVKNRPVGEFDFYAVGVHAVFVFDILKGIHRPAVPSGTI